MIELKRYSNKLLYIANSANIIISKVKAFNYSRFIPRTPHMDTFFSMPILVYTWKINSAGMEKASSSARGYNFVTYARIEVKIRVE